MTTTCEICHTETQADRCLGDGPPHCDSCMGACIECGDVLIEDALIERAERLRKGDTA